MQHTLKITLCPNHNNSGRNYYIRYKLKKKTKINCEKVSSKIGYSQNSTATTTNTDISLSIQWYERYKNKKYWG